VLGADHVRPGDHTAPRSHTTDVLVVCRGTAHTLDQLLVAVHGRVPCILKVKHSAIFIHQTALYDNLKLPDNLVKLSTKRPIIHLLETRNKLRYCKTNKSREVTGIYR